MEKCNDEIIQWEIKVPIFRNAIIAKELGIAIGIPFGILIIILLFISKGDISRDGMGYPLLFISGFFAIAFLFIMFIYGGKYEVGYVIDTKGILNYTQKKQAKKNKMMNFLLLAVGILSGKPSMAGTALLAQSRQSMLLKWKNIKKVKIYPRSKSIVIRGSFTEKVALFCNDDNFDLVKDVILNKANLIGR